MDVYMDVSIPFHMIMFSCVCAVFLCDCFHDGLFFAWHIFHCIISHVFLRPVCVRAQACDAWTSGIASRTEVWIGDRTRQLDCVSWCRMDRASGVPQRSR